MLCGRPSPPVPVQSAECLCSDRFAYIDYRLSITDYQYPLLGDVRSGNPERKTEMENTIDRDTLPACDGPGGNVMNAYMYCFYLDTVRVIVD
jgi:hypothetical protein